MPGFQRQSEPQAPQREAEGWRWGPRSAQQSARELLKPEGTWNWTNMGAHPGLQSERRSLYVLQVA